MSNLTTSTAVDTFMQALTKAQMRSSMDLGDSATKNVGIVAGTVCAGDDSRLTNARTPTAHASTHAAAGTDPVTLSQSQITNLVSDLAAKVATNSAAALSSLTLSTPLAAIYGGTGQSLYVAGDMLYATSSTLLTRVGIGANGAIWQSNGVNPSWSSHALSITGNSVINQDVSTTGAPNFASIGAGTPGTGAFTTLNATGAISQITASGAEAKLNLNQIGITQWSLRNIATTGAFYISEGGNDWLTIAKTTGATVLNGAVTISAGLAVTGALNVSGTVSGTNALVVNSTGANDAFVSFNNSGGGYGGYTWNLRTYAATGKLSFLGSSDWMQIDYATGATTFTTLSASSNANLRTTKTNLHLVINVKDYGALGDGSTNDTTAIASAKSDAISAHGTLYFPPGTYITDQIAVASASGLTICGDGEGVSVLKRRVANSSGGVLNVSASDHVNLYGLTFDGNCNTRTAGAQAVTFDASSSSVHDIEIINSGEYAFFAGSGATTVSDLKVSRVYIHACYADGINFQNVTKSTISDPTVDGADDDLIAIGFNGSGAASSITINGGYLKARNDLGTTWGRGLAIIGASNVIANGVTVEGAKQHGLYIAKETGSRPTNILINGCMFNGNAISSGHSIAIYQSTDVTLSNVQSINPVQGSLCEIADWQNLTILGGQYTQETNVFGRGIHCDEGGGWASSWDNLRIIGPSITMSGASTNSCVYLNPINTVTMNTGSIVGVNGSQIVAGDYITVGTARMGTLWKIGNNTTLTASRTVNPASSSGVYTVFNNN